MWNQFCDHSWKLGSVGAIQQKNKLPLPEPFWQKPITHQLTKLASFMGMRKWKQSQPDKLTYWSTNTSSFAGPSPPEDRVPRISIISLSNVFLNYNKILKIFLTFGFDIFA